MSQELYKVLIDMVECGTSVNDTYTKICEQFNVEATVNTEDLTFGTLVRWNNSDDIYSVISCHGTNVIISNGAELSSDEYKDWYVPRNELTVIIFRKGS